MRRREFITLLGGAAAAWPLAARAQQPAGRVYRVGYFVIASRERSLHLMKAFEEGLRSLGYRVGENVVIEYRFANGEMERLPALATDLVRPRCGHHGHRVQSDHGSDDEGDHNHPDCHGYRYRSGSRRVCCQSGALREGGLCRSPI